MYISGSELWVVPEAFAIEYHYNRYSYLLKPVESKWEVRIEFAIISYMVKDFLLTNDTRFDTFNADKYILFQSLTTIEKDIYIRILNEKNQDKHLILDLDDWRNI